MSVMMVIADLRLDILTKMIVVEWIGRPLVTPIQKEVGAFGSGSLLRVGPSFEDQSIIFSWSPFRVFG